MNGLSTSQRRMVDGVSRSMTETDILRFGVGISPKDADKSWLTSSEEIRIISMNRTGRRRSMPRQRRQQEFADVQLAYLAGIFESSLGLRGIGTNGATGISNTEPWV